MEKTRSCPVCGTALNGSAPQGLCPACLLKAAIGDPEAAPPLEAVPAGRIFGDYQIRGPLGHGGMGVVYAARQISLNRPVALKMVRAPHLASDSDLARFRQEAEAAARLDHPNIVPVYEAGERDGVQYFTMKLVEGARSLASDLAKGPMEPRAAAKLMLKIARAVHYAHQRGVIHRDIKPANILMDSSGEPQLADFGLAKLLETTISFTQCDRVIGTPQYMSPEQVQGHSRELTPATDIYSLGAVHYEMLTGQPPFHSESIHEILRLVVEKEPRAPRQLNGAIDRDLQTVCLKCLEKIPARRYASANDLADDLESWIAVRPISARPVTGVERLKKWGRRNPVVTGLTGALLLVGLLAVGFLIRASREADRAAREAAHEADQRDRTILVQKLNEYSSKASEIRQRVNMEGRRWLAMSMIEKTREIMAEPALPKEAAMRVMRELQNEAIACLSLVDIRPAQEWQSGAQATLSPDFVQYAEILDGRIVVSRFSDRSGPVTLRTGSIPASMGRFSADGRRFATVHLAEGGERRLVILDVATGSPVFEQSAPDDSVFDINADGSRLASVVSGELRVVEIPSGKRGPLPASSGNPDTIRFSPDGRKIAISRRDGHVTLLDVGTGAVIATCREDSLPHCIAWAPGGRWLAIGGVGQIFIWDTLHPGSDHSARMWQAHNGAIENVAWHPNGVLLASESDGTVVLWNARTGSLQVTSSKQSQNGLHFKPDGSRLGLFRQGDHLNLLEVNPGTFGRHASGHPGYKISGVSWSFGGGRVLATAAVDAVRFWNRAGESIGTINVKGARSVLWERNSLFVTGHNGIMRWPLTEGDDGKSSRLSLGRMKMIDPRPNWERAAISTPDSAGNSKWLAVTHPERTLLMRTDDDGSAVELPGQLGAAFATISQDDRWLATGAKDGQGVRVWSLPDRAPVTDIPVSGDANVSFSLNEKLDHSEWLVTGNGDEYCFWKVGEWIRQAPSIPTKLGFSSGAIAFSWRGTALALESEKHRIKIIYPHPPSFLELAAPDFDRQSPLCFSPKGGLLVDVDERSHVILWDLAQLRRDLKPLGLDWKMFDEIDDPELPLVEEVTVDDGP